MDVDPQVLLYDAFKLTMDALSYGSMILRLSDVTVEFWEYFSLFRFAWMAVKNSAAGRARERRGPANHVIEVPRAGRRCGGWPMKQK